MRKSTIIKFIDGKCSQDESENVLEWLEKDKRNRDYLDNLKSLIERMELAEIIKPQTETENGSGEKLSCRKHKVWRITAAAAAVLLISSISLNIYHICKRPAEAEEVVKVLDNGILRELGQVTYYTCKGVKSSVTLPDGSKVTLNSDSRLTIPEVFTGKYREVDFSGEGYFEVTHDEDNPMIITTKNGVIEVLGTTFNIRSYDDDEATATTLLSGKVKIKSSEEKYSDNYLMELAPMETAVMRHNIAVRQIQKVDTVKTVAWKEGKIIFEDAPMEKVIHELERWHGCDFVIDDSNVLQYYITARFDSKSIKEILEMIKLCSPVNYRMQNDTIHLCTTKR